MFHKAVSDIPVQDQKANKATTKKTCVICF